jgi:hypothetical protein
MSMRSFHCWNTSPRPLKMGISKVVKVGAQVPWVVSSPAELTQYEVYSVNTHGTTCRTRRKARQCVNELILLRRRELA